MERTVWDLSRLYGAWREAAALNVVFQPLVHIPSGQAFGFEALSRPQLNRQSIPIGILLESASTVNQLSDFDRFALPAILNSASQLNYPEALRLFINFSPLTLLNPDFIFDAFRAPGIRIKPAQVVIEISERESIPEAIDLESLLMPYRDANMKIALDDFGAGYSGLNRLVSLQPDYAKIDLNLVRDIDKNAAKHALVESTVLFAGRSGQLQLLAEGIETPAELAALHELGISLGQGHLLGRPKSHLKVKRHRIPLDVRRHIPDEYEQLQSFINTAHRLIDGVGSGEGLVSHIVHLAGRLLAADAVSWWKPDGEWLRLKYALPDLPDDLQVVSFSNPNPSYHAMVQRRTIIFQTAAECAASPLGPRLQYQSMMLVPVTDRAQSQSLLVIAYHRPLQIRPQEIKIAEGLARLMALGTFSSAPGLEAETPGVGEPLFEAISSLVVQEDLDSLLAKVMEAALSVSGGHLGYIGLLTPETLHAVTAAKESFEFDRMDLFDPRTDDGRGPVGQVLRLQQPVVIQDITLEPTLTPWRQEMLADGIQAALGLPLISNGTMLGILKVYHSHRYGFEAGRIRRLEALASLATAIILKWQEEHGTHQRYVHEKTDVIVSLLPRLMTASAQEGYALVEEAVCRVMDGELSGLLTLQSGTLTPADSQDPIPEAYRETVLEASHDALRKRCVVIRENKTPEHQIAAMPILIGGEARGAIWVASTKPASLNHAELTELLSPHLMMLSLTAGAHLVLQERR
ncbi:MAG: EAL domain-containing protein [Firmicutes bacterium]|nr:EAL domain-containing protein [Bacillota bacterium]